jgi:hypothetical protein
MSAAAVDLDDIKRKHNIKNIRIATWRNPALSVHSARGGPASPLVSSKPPYIPQYKKYAIPDPTDDEQSGKEDSRSVKDEERESRSLLLCSEPPGIVVARDCTLVRRRSHVSAYMRRECQ